MRLWLMKQLNPSFTKMLEKQDPSPAHPPVETGKVTVRNHLEAEGQYDSKMTLFIFTL